MAGFREEFSEDHTPRGYLITFRSYGTWFHGDQRGSVDRFHRLYGSPKLRPNQQRKIYERRASIGRPQRLNSRQRQEVLRAIQETCTFRKWLLWKCNVRSNHVHAVVTANCGPSQVLNALKANATRCMREAGCWREDHSPWISRGSKRYLWTENDLMNAIAYVEYEQGET